MYKVATLNFLAWYFGMEVSLLKSGGCPHPQRGYRVNFAAKIVRGHQWRGWWLSWWWRWDVWWWWWHRWWTDSCGNSGDCLCRAVRLWWRWCRRRGGLKQGRYWEGVRSWRNNSFLLWTSQTLIRLWTVGRRGWWRQGSANGKCTSTAGVGWWHRFGIMIWRWGSAGRWWYSR